MIFLIDHNEEGRGQEAEEKLLSVTARDQSEKGFKTPTLTAVQWL
jgi:hypothetical protein